MSLEKRIKRLIIGRRHPFFAATLPGFERLCADELAPLSETLEVESTVPGGVAFSGRLPDLYRASLQSRTAVRIVMRLSTFKATNFNQLESHTRKIAWEQAKPCPKYVVACSIRSMVASCRYSSMQHPGRDTHPAYVERLLCRPASAQPSPEVEHPLLDRCRDSGP